MHDSGLSSSYSGDGDAEGGAGNVIHTNGVAEDNG